MARRDTEDLEEWAGLEERLFELLQSSNTSHTPVRQGSRFAPTLPCQAFIPFGESEQDVGVCRIFLVMLDSLRPTSLPIILLRPCVPNIPSYYPTAPLRAQHPSCGAQGCHYGGAWAHEKSRKCLKRDPFRD